MAASVNARSIAFVCVAYLMFGSGAAQGQGIAPPSAYQHAASDAGIPASVLFAVALQESGTTVRGRLIPWPWTLNTDGIPHRFSRRAEACAALRLGLTQYGNIDVGLCQISVRYHGHRVREPCELLDPYRNLAIAAAILREHHAPGENWLAAIGHYHRPAGGEAAARYRRSVQRHLARISAPTVTDSPGTHE
jgi:soluble lytic murein transglycosylase-like protein